jgi:ADP-heptose:LPS heptosyltransferase
LASALFEDIHQAFPNAEIHLNTAAANQKLFAADSRFSKIIIIAHHSCMREIQPAQMLAMLTQPPAISIIRVAAHILPDL